jgi:signal transduction histidine kinase
MGNRVIVDVDAMLDVADQVEVAADGLAMLLQVSAKPGDSASAAAAQSATEQGRQRVGAVVRDLREIAAGMRSTVYEFELAEQRNAGHYPRQ